MEDTAKFAVATRSLRHTRKTAPKNNLFRKNAKAEKKRKSHTRLQELDRHDAVHNKKIQVEEF